MKAQSKMSTKEVHANHWGRMEASFKAKTTCLAQFDIEVAGVAEVEYFAEDKNLPAAMQYTNVQFNYELERTQKLVGKDGVFAWIENINAVSLWLRLPSGQVVPSGMIPVENLFTKHGKFYKELAECVNEYPARNVSSVMLEF